MTPLSRICMPLWLVSRGLRSLSRLLGLVEPEIHKWLEERTMWSRDSLLDGHQQTMLQRLGTWLIEDPHSGFEPIATLPHTSVAPSVLALFEQGFGSEAFQPSMAPARTTFSQNPATRDEASPTAPAADPLSKV